METGASLFVNGSLNSVASTTPVPLDLGNNRIPILVRSKNGSVDKNYWLTILRSPPTNADLSSLTVNPGSLTTPFSPEKVAYAVNLGESTSIGSLEITAETVEAGSTMTIAGQPAASNVSKNVSLSQGANLIPIVITAPDNQTEKAYILSVNGTVSNANLGSLSVSLGSLSFSPNTTSYTVNVDNSITSIDLSAIPSDSKAVMLLNGTMLTAGATHTVSLNPGSTTITVMVVAQNASTKTYTITVNRAIDLAIDTTSLPVGIIGSPFSASLAAVGGTGTYTWNSSALPAGLSLNTSNGQITGTPTNTGNYNVSFTVNDGGGHTATASFVLTVAQSIGIDLANLSVSQGTLSPAFDCNTVTYHLNSESAINSLNITATLADPAATLTINSQSATSSAAQAVNLAQGTNLIPIVVTASGINTQTAYILSVNGTVSNANLGSLSVSPGSLSFSPNTTSYMVNVDTSITSVDLSATPSDSKAIMLLNGAILTAGATHTISLNPGSTTITVMVVAQDASTKTYTITVNRALPLTINTNSLPLGIVSMLYNSPINVTGGTGTYSWNATGLPSSLILGSDGVICGTPTVSDIGTRTVSITVTDSASNSTSTSLTLQINLGCGNGAYLIVPENDSSYTAGLTADGIPTMTVNSGISGYKYFSVTITPVSGHTGREVAVFVHMRGNTQMGIMSFKADYDNSGNSVQASFNVRAGDVIKSYVVDNLSNMTGSSPTVL